MYQYLVDRDSSIDLNISKDSNFIISLYSNGIVAYRWNIKNNFDTEILSLENISRINIPTPSSQKNQIGVNYDRQNFYFKPLKIGTEKLELKYEHETEQRDDSFGITFNIEIE